MKIKTFYAINPYKWLFLSNKAVEQAQQQALENGSIKPEENNEYLRQWLLHELINTYGYPNDWILHRIDFEKTSNIDLIDQKIINMNISSKKNNILILMVIFSNNSEKIDERTAEKELERILVNNSSATIGLVTNGIETRIIQKKLKSINFEYISDLPDYQPVLASNTILKRNMSQIKLDSKTVGLQCFPKRLKNIFFEIHSAIRDIDGLHDDEALDELCKILYAKIYDEKTIIADKVIDNKIFNFQVNGYANESEVASDIRSLYQEACSFELTNYSEKIPAYERSRGVFTEPIILSDTAIAKIVEKLQIFSIIDSDYDIKSIIFQQVLGRAIRSGMGQFFTPDEIVRLAVEVTAPKSSDFILDPFCGSGHFLSRSLDYVVANCRQVDSNSLNEFKLFHLHGIEKSARMVRIAMTDMLLHDDGYTNIRNIDSLAPEENFLDFQAIEKENRNNSLAIFDLILTNPPFGVVLGSESSNFNSHFQIVSKRKNNPLEVLALERCFQFLKKGGKLAIVLPDGNLANFQTQFVRDWILQNFKLKAVVSLPSETFAPYGTTTKTSLCFFQKFHSETEKNHDYDIAFYKIDNIGYDATGREIPGSELQDAIKFLQENLHWD